MQILVLGMHRSGTSAIARLINMMGADIGPSHLIGEPAPDNEKGFWERRDVKELNDNLLEKLGFNWNTIASFNQEELIKNDELAELRDQAKRIVFHMDTHRPWIMKDPRLCLTLPFWLPFLEVPVCVFPYRFPIEIAKSLQARDSFSLIFSIALWEKYTIEALRSTQSLPKICVSYPNLISNPVNTVHDLYQNLCEADVQGLRMPSDREIIAFVENRLHHQRETSKIADNIINENQRHLAKSLDDGSILLWSNIPDLSAGALEILEEHDQQYKREAQNREILKSVREEVNSLHQQINNTSNEITELRRELDATHGEMIGLRQERDAIQKQAIELDSHLAQARSETEQARSETEQARSETEQARSETEQARSETEQARSETEQARSELRELFQQLELARRELDQTQSNHQLSLKVKQEQIELINEQLNKAQDQLTQLSQSLAIKEHQESHLFNELSLLENWLKQIEQNFTATLHSWRWRVGHSTISLVEKLLLRRRVLLGVDHIQALLRQFQSHSVNIESHGNRILQTPTPSATPIINTIHAPKILESPQSIPTSYDLICFANIDWNARYQRPQQIATQFARHGHRVFYIIASRCLSPDDIQGFRASAVAENIFEVELMADAVLDRYSTVLDTANTEFFSQSIGRLRDKFGIVDAVCNIHLAFWTPLALHLRNHWGWNVLYDCMDEWEDFPNIGKPLLEAEKQLVTESDIVTVTAALLEQKWKNHNPHCVLVRNGVDFDFYRQHYQPSQILNHITHPIIGFFGALAEWVDLGLLAAVARARPDWQLVLLGDVFVTDLEGLDTLANVHLLGRRPYEEMPLYLYHFDVCLIPFRINQVTHAVDPVKFYEYVSAGKPVVSVPLKELEIYKDYLYFADTKEDFVVQIECAIAENNPKLQQVRIDLARKNDWQHRYKSMADAISTSYGRVSIIIVTYKNVDLTQLCLEKLLKNTTYPNYEIIVVDNDSRDGTANYLQYMEERYENIKVIINSNNRGFAAANNQGLTIATGEYLVLLNNDTVTPRGWLAPLLTHLKEKEIGLVGPVTNFVGNEAKINVPYSTLDEMEHFATQHMRQYEGKIFDIKVLAMFCVAMRRDVYEMTGPLDESFGIGMFEDDDYSNRIKQLGYRVVCAEDSFVHHFGQAAFKKLIESGEYHEIWKRNQSYYEQKWGKWEPHANRASEEINAAH